MKIYRFIKAIIQFTAGHCVSYVEGIPNLWTDEDIYWSLRQTYFFGKDAEEKRDKYVIENEKLVDSFK